MEKQQNEMFLKETIRQGEYREEIAGLYNAIILEERKEQKMQNITRALKPNPKHKFGQRNKVIEIDVDKRIILKEDDPDNLVFKEANVNWTKQANQVINAQSEASSPIKTRPKIGDG